MCSLAARCALIGLLALGLAACAPAARAPAASPGEGAPDVRGRVTQIEPGPAPGGLGRLRIESAKGAGTRYDQAVAAITTSTGLYAREGTARRPAAFADLKVGQQVEVWFAGPVAESYPVQGTASQVVIQAIEPAASEAAPATATAVSPTTPPTTGRPEPTSQPAGQSGPAVPPAVQPAAARLAQAALARQLQLATDAVTILSVEAVEWPDACLGVQIPDRMCAQVITPGYRVVLEAGGKQYELHTNENGSSVQRATP